MNYYTHQLVKIGPFVTIILQIFRPANSGYPPCFSGKLRQCVSGRGNTSLELARYHQRSNVESNFKKETAVTATMKDKKAVQIQGTTKK